MVDRILGLHGWAVLAVVFLAPALEASAFLGVVIPGEIAVLLDAAGRDEANAARLEGLFTAARQAEWAEFVADCGKYEAELDKEIHTQKFTLAELDEEEQSLDRLRRWYRDIKLRDLFGAPAAAEAEQRLKHCAERLEDYADRVYQAVHQP